MSFTPRFALVFAIAVGAAVAISPLAALAAAALGLHFPFPRIFDRTVMVTLLVALFFPGGRLGLVIRVLRGFVPSALEFHRALRGFLVAIASIAALWTLATALGARAASQVLALIPHLARYSAAALLIAIIEEGFFRAFLLDGMETDLGRIGSLAASSAVYAIAHLVRSPARFYASGFEPLAGVRNLTASLAALGDGNAMMAGCGLFMLGLVLGEAFLLTRKVYFSVGMHAGIVIGLRFWRAIVESRAALPGWLFGSGRFPIVSGAAAWIVAVVILATLRPLTRSARRPA